MALIKCPECGKQISDRANICPHCGCPLTPQEKNNVVPEPNNPMSDDAEEANLRGDMSEECKSQDENIVRNEASADVAAQSEERAEEDTQKESSVEEVMENEPFVEEDTQSGPQNDEAVEDDSTAATKSGFKIVFPTRWTTPEPFQKRTMLIMLIVICIVVAVILLAVGLSSNTSMFNRDGLYDHLAWGTPYEKVAKSVERHNNVDVHINDDSKNVYEIVENYDGYTDAEAYNVYVCEDDGTLHEIMVGVDFSDSPYTSYDMYGDLSEKFSKMYEKDYTLSYSDVWRTSISEIEIIVGDEDLILITLDDLETVD